ncbi:MAG: hypothetical protein ACRDRU_01955 [Pseudonocardiaceae bacterium]
MAGRLGCVHEASGRGESVSCLQGAGVVVAEHPPHSGERVIAELPGWPVIAVVGAKTYRVLTGRGMLFP